MIDSLGFNRDTLGSFLAAFKYFGPYSASTFVEVSGRSFSELARVLNSSSFKDTHSVL